jgi:multicomponent Na+:H+ antiporter subunit E
MRMIGSLAVLLAAWLLWSGLYKPLLVLLGIGSCLLTLVLARRMGFFHDNVFSLHLIGRLLPFWRWLGAELVRSNLAVARIVLHPRLPISPTVVRITALPPDPVGQAILGNAITLTPGTVTIDDHEGELIVHCLTREGAAALEAGEMNRRAAALTQS